jgi:exopolysaccharide biosynthesis protein
LELDFQVSRDITPDQILKADGSKRALAVGQILVKDITNGDAQFYRVSKAVHEADV